MRNNKLVLWIVSILIAGIVCLYGIGIIGSRGRDIIILCSYGHYLELVPLFLFVFNVIYVYKYIINTKYNNTNIIFIHLAVFVVVLFIPLLSVNIINRLELDFISISKINLNAHEIEAIEDIGFDERIFPFKISCHLEVNDICIYFQKSPGRAQIISNAISAKLQPSKNKS